MKNSNQKELRSPARAYDNMEEAQRYARLGPPAGIGDRVRDRYLSIVKSYLSSKLISRSMSRGLDIGCCSGRFTKALLENGIQAVGIDTAAVPLSLATRLVPEGQFIRSSATSLPFQKESFDVIVCIELLHHFTNKVLEEVLDQVVELLRPRGAFIFDLKNKWNPVLSYSYRKRYSKEFTLKARSIPEMARLLKRRGFEVLDRKSVLLPLLPLDPFIVFLAIKMPGA